MKVMCQWESECLDQTGWYVIESSSHKTLRADFKKHCDEVVEEWDKRKAKMTKKYDQPPFYRPHNVRLVKYRPECVSPFYGS